MTLWHGLRLAVNPARAGMIRARGAPPPAAGGKPRASGDDPETDGKTLTREQ